MSDKIQVGYDSKTGLYIFKKPHHSNFKVNDKPVDDPLRGYKSGYLVTTSEKPKSFTYTNTTRKTSGYVDAETGATIDVEDYNNIVAKINTTRKYDDDAEEFIYDSIEAEVYATRFFRNHQAVYETIETKHQLEFEIIEYPVSEYAEIVPLYTVDSKNVFNTKCQYTPDLTTLFFEITQKYGIDKSRIDIPNHSGLRFIKIDNNYVGGTDEFQKNYGRQIIDTYPNCVDRMQMTRTKLDEVIFLHLAKKSQKVLDKATVGSVLNDLINLESRVNSLDVKLKDASSQRSTVSKIREMINTYKQLA